MPLKNHLQEINLSGPKQLQTLIENRRVFNLRNCELNIFETYQQAYDIPLTFGDFVITSMVRGKKIMHLPDQPVFEYLPGETVIVPSNQTMVIDFPEACDENPTQCIALTLDMTYINEALAYLNNFYSTKDEAHNWQLHMNQYHFENDNEVSALINKIIRICSSNETGKNIFADLNVKELLIRLIQSQHLQTIETESVSNNTSSRLHYVVNYIQEHITEKIAVDLLSRKAYLNRNIFFKWFKEQFGITPVEYINRERIKLAKQLLLNPHNKIPEISSRCGFSDVNYFIRVFKKSEGITPKVYQYCASKIND